MEEVLSHKPQVHLIVCINERNDRDSCAPTVTHADIKVIKYWILGQGWSGIVQCTASGCQGHCNPGGGVATIYPSGKRYKNITTQDELKQIIADEFESSE